ncbi:MAG: ABC transporter substrate-binding protein [Methanomassiliicoccales archaeon]|nr:MAG: ABC transporter substrate-binding protein [Methanomassiliicoccales archaeon]
MASRMGRRGAVFAIVFLLTVSGYFGMIIPAEEYEPQGGMYGGDLRIALKGDIEEDPLLVNDNASLMVVSLLYDSLARIDSISLMPIPWVATDWNVTTDTTVNVSIRTDVEWHDSTDENPRYITADDIVYTFNDAGGMKSSAHWADVLVGVTCSKVDDDTVTFDLSGAPNSRGIFFSKVLTMPIIPSGFDSSWDESGSGPYQFGARGTYSYVIGDDVVVESAAAGQLYAIGGAHYHYIADSVYDTAQVDFYKNGSLMSGTTYNLHPENGTVDFTTPLNGFEKITANYSITSKFTSIVAFERHFDRRPYLDSINYTFFPDNPTTTEVDEATDGTIKAMIDQFVDFIGFPLVEGSQNVLRWEGDPDQKKLFDPDLVPHVLVQTKNPTFKFLYLGMNTEFTPLNDPLFRRGISMSIKRELANLYIPTAVIADSVIHPSNTFWYNESIDKFRVPKDEDGDPIYTDIINHFQDSGYLDPDEDGFMENLTGADFKLRLFVPLSAEDPSASSIGQDIGQTFNDVGIDAETINAETSSFMNDVVAGDFELYLTTYEVEADPIFLYDILHKDNIPPLGTKRNYVRLDNATMNSLLDNVRTQLDQDKRKEYVQSSLAWIASNAPLATILHFNILEAYEKVSYEGWVQMTGGVNNFWSYLYVHYQQKGEMKAQFVVYVNSIDSGDILEFGVSVTDMIDMPLEGAWVKVTNSYSDDVVINYTDSGGYAGFNWTAPHVASPTTVDFTATVTIPQYDKVIVESSITVHPILEKLEVTIGVTESRIKSGGETTVVVDVKDDFTGLAIPDATVILNIVRPQNGPGSFGAFTGTTDANGRFETTFTADVTTSMQFTLDASAVVEGYAPGTSQATSVIVDPVAQPTPGFEAVIVVLAVLLAVVLVGAWRGARSRKEKE